MTARLKLIGATLVGAVLGVVVMAIGTFWADGLLLCYHEFTSFLVYDPAETFREMLAFELKDPQKTITRYQFYVPVLGTGPVLGAVTTWTGLKQDDAALTCIKLGGLVLFFLIAFHLYLICYESAEKLSVLLFLLCYPAFWWSLLLMRWGYVLNKRSQT